MTLPARSDVAAKAQRALLEPLIAAWQQVVVGQRALLDRLLIGLLTDGHILLEGVPGLAKTLAVRCLAAGLDLKYARIQFTPDLLPADLVGTQIYNPKTGDFTARPGPIFANILLADEINRAPAKVQSALLEAMQERQVTLGDATLPLPRPFFVMATQNPLEQEGTYPLPEAQVDRFLMKLLVEYPSRAEEMAILDRAGGLDAETNVPKSLTAAELAQLRAAADATHVDPKVKEYLLTIVRATRHPAEHGLNAVTPLLESGASPRGGIALLRAAKAHAFLAGRHYLLPDDVKLIAPDVLRHRVRLSFEADARELSADAIVRQILAGIPVP